MRKLGQHFLKNKSALQSITDALDLAPDDVVVEIGPGHGELTEFLLATPIKRIVAIEKDQALYLFLKDKFNGDARVTIVEGDALKILPSVISDQQLPPYGYKIAGNIPYYITGHLFRILGELDSRPSCCSFTIQKEVAERICAVPPRMNRLAASIQFWANAKILKTLPASDFSPPPKVSSAIIVLHSLESTGSPMKEYYAALRALFAQPRKTLSNNLAKAVGEKGDAVAKKLSSIGMVPNNRPQNLSVADIAAIARAFFTS